MTHVYIHVKLPTVSPVKCPLKETKLEGNQNAKTKIGKRACACMYVWTSHGSPSCSAVFSAVLRVNAKLTH